MKLLGAVTVAALAAGLPWPLLAASGGDEAVEEIVVVGARLPRPVQDVAATVDVISREELQETIATRASDLVRYTPGVSMSEAGTRFGDSDFTIRGLSGNRVLHLIDGVPVADQFDIGDFSSATQDYLVPDAISRVEVLRGPASSLFGSDALGGVVAVITRDPNEFLEGERTRVTTSAAYSGADASEVLNASAAAGGERLAGVVHLSRVDGRELDHAAEGRNDRLDRERKGAMTKVTYALDDGARLRLRADGFDEQVDSDLRSVLGWGRRYVNSTSLLGDDARRRWSAGVGYDVGGGHRGVSDGRIDVFAASTRVEQVTHEMRTIATPPVALEREFDYEQDVWGIVADLESRFEVGPTEHRLGWGASYDRRDVQEYRTGLQTNLVTGGTTRVLLGENMPVRDFPNAAIAELGIYVHDEIAIGALTFIPALRLDDYSMNAKPDAMYRADNIATTAVDMDETALSPKLGLLWHATGVLTVFGQYAHGFRAPPFEDVNIGLDIPRFNFRAIPNPDLKAEESDGLEVGVRGTGETLRWSASVFAADYDEFIESKVNLGPDPESGVIIFQSRNIGQARVYGAEFDVEADLDAWLGGTSVGVAGNWTRGENRDNHEPLNSVDPPELVLRFAWTPRESMRYALMSTFVARQDEVDDSTVHLFQPDSFVTIDALATLRPRPDVRVDLGIFNLFDETYWRWSAVRGRPVDDPMIGALSAPGRYGSVSVQIAL